MPHPISITLDTDLMGYRVSLMIPDSRYALPLNQTQSGMVNFALRGSLRSVGEQPTSN